MGDGVVCSVIVIIAIAIGILVIVSSCRHRCCRYRPGCCRSRFRVVVVVVGTAAYYFNIVIVY